MTFHSLYLQRLSSQTETWQPLPKNISVDCVCQDAVPCPDPSFIPDCLVQTTLNWGKSSWSGSHILKTLPSLPSSRLSDQTKQIPLGMALIKKLNRTGSEKDNLPSTWVVHQLWTCGNCSEHLPKAAGLEESRGQFPCSSGFPLHASLSPVKIHSVLSNSHYIIRVWVEKKLFCQL